MNNAMKAIAAIMLVTAIVCTAGCKKAKVPTVETTQAGDITATEATVGGFVVADGGAELIERGVCWSIEANPDISTNLVNAGTGLGSFTCTLTGLEPATTYYVRAYAYNSVGVAYGEEVTFTTLEDDNGGDDNGGNTDGGAIDGLFSVSEGTQVHFSQGNLQYQASTNTWRFAIHQYDIVGNDNSNISQTYSGWIDLFGWGTSGWDSGNTYYRPWDYEYADGNQYGTPGAYSFIDDYVNSDWGYYNAISNGGNTTHQWRTLTHDEWDYVFNTRSTSSGIRYAKAQVNNINGMILLPDDWNSSYYNLNDINTNNASFSTNVMSSSTWTNSLQSHGAVFLPAAGSRQGTWISNVGIGGNYWSATRNGVSAAYLLSFYDNNLYTHNAGIRSGGWSVRLVCSAN